MSVPMPKLFELGLAERGASSTVRVSTHKVKRLRVCGDEKEASTSPLVGLSLTPSAYAGGPDSIGLINFV